MWITINLDIDLDEGFKFWSELKLKEYTLLSKHNVNEVDFAQLQSQEYIIVSCLSFKKDPMNNNLIE